MKILKYTIDVAEPTSFIDFEIEGGNQDWCIGDRVWFSADGKEMSISSGVFCNTEDEEELISHIGEENFEIIKEIFDNY